MDSPLERMVKHDGDHLCLMRISPSSSVRSKFLGSSPTPWMASTKRLLCHFCNAGDPTEGYSLVFLGGGSRLRLRSVPHLQAAPEAPKLFQKADYPLTNGPNSAASRGHCGVRTT